MIPLLNRRIALIPPLPSSPLLLLSKTLATTAPKPSLPTVAVFWDLDNKPPNSIPPYDAAVRLNLAAAALGPVRLTVAYANHHAFRHVPAPVRAARRALSRPDPQTCRVCGRSFYDREKLLSHFRQLHEREQSKRQRRIESARGGRRVKLVGELSMKMDKYNRAARDLLVPKVGYGLADELRRAGVLVKTVDDKPEAADRALRAHMVDVMDRGKIGCLVLVSDDNGFAGVIREARMRCLRTVVVGDELDGALKRCADKGFSWREVVSGKARKEAASAVGKWNDRDLLKRLEWTYNPEPNSSIPEFNDSIDAGGEALGLGWKKEAGPWWKLESEDGEASEMDDVEDRVRGPHNC